MTNSTLADDFDSTDSSSLGLKVPSATALFWVLKTLTTGMGETTSDYLVGAMNPKIAVLACATALGVSLLVQWLLPRFSTWIYWIAVLMVGIFGTMVADVIHRALGIPYVVSSICFALSLGLTFLLWARVEGTLSIHSISTRRREFFYWCVVLLTFALGTALGDMSAHSLGLGYFPSALGYGVLIILPLIAWRYFGLNEVTAFWLAYIATRPLGASFADWFGAPAPRGGLGLGFGPVSALLGLLFLTLVILAARTCKTPSA